MSKILFGVKKVQILRLQKERAPIKRKIMLHTRNSKIMIRSISAEISHLPNNQIKQVLAHLERHIKKLQVMTRKEVLKFVFLITNNLKRKHPLVCKMLTKTIQHRC